MPRQLELIGCALAACLLSGCAPEPAAPEPTGTPSPTATLAPTPSRTTTPTLEPPTPTLTVTPCGEPAGQVVHGVYPGVAVPGEVPLAVYLPPCYAAQEGELPALVLLHGYPFDEDHWLDLGAAQAADALIAVGKRQPFLMILPRQPEPLFRGSDGGPGSYETELLEGLLPYVQLDYRAAGSPDGWALAGISRGGVWALEIGFRHPETFFAVGAMSPALAVNSARAPYDPLQIVLTDAELPGRLMLLAGEQDWAARQTQKLAGLLESSGRPHTLLLVPGDHSAGTWQLGMGPMLEFLTESWVVGP